MSLKSISVGGPYGTGPSVTCSIALPAPLAAGDELLSIFCNSGSGGLMTAPGWTNGTQTPGVHPNHLSLIHVHAVGDLDPVVFTMPANSFLVQGFLLAYTQGSLGVPHRDFNGISSIALPANFNVTIAADAVAVDSKIVYAAYVATNTSDPLPAPHVLTMPPESTFRTQSPDPPPGRSWMKVSDEQVTAASEPARTFHFEVGGAADFAGGAAVRYVILLPDAPASRPGFGFGTDPFGP